MTGELRILRTTARQWLVRGTPATSCFMRGRTQACAPLGRRSWHSSRPPAGSAGFRSGIVAAPGQSLHRGLSARPRVHDEVVAMVGAVGRTGVLRTGNGA